MNKKLWKLPVLTSIGALILHILVFIFIFVGYGGSWTPRVARLLTYVPLALNILLVLIIGLILRRTYDKKTFFKAASLLVIYSIVISILQRAIIYLGIDNFTFNFILYLPIELFGMIESLFLRTQNPYTTNWILVFITLFEPYIFLLFAKKSKNISRDI